MTFYSLKTLCWRQIAAGCTAAAMLSAVPQVVSAQSDIEAPATQSLDQQAVEVIALDQGPIHEAYATPVTLNPEPGPVIQEIPPEEVDEVPPDFRPEGRNVRWIPGYWAFVDAADQDEQSSFIDTGFVWVSGVWRDIPQGRNWVPGFWTEVPSENGFQWIPGFWASEEQGLDQLTYVPEPPPASLDRGPSSPAPSADHFWVPGYWDYASNDYQWRPGYWYERPQNFVWVPNCYQYTPRGYVFNRGYWDYPLSRRGLAYAPVRFGRRGAGSGIGSGFRGRFTPNRFLSPVNLLTSLYIAPRTSRYVYGGFGLNSRNFVPLTRAGNLNGFYDPIFRDIAWRQGRGNQNFSRDWERRYLERVQDFQNSDLADTQRLIRDVSTLSNGGSIGNIVVNRINDEVRQQAVDYRLDQINRRQQRFRSEIRDTARDATDTNPLERSAAKIPSTEDSTQNIGEAAEDPMQRARERINNAAERARQQAEMNRDDLRNRGENAAECVENARENPAERAEDVRENARGNIGDLRDRMERNRRDASGALERARERAQETRENAGQSAAETRERARENAGDARERGRSLFNGQDAPASPSNRGAESRSMQDRGADRGSSAAEGLRNRLNRSTNEAGNAAQQTRERMERGQQRAGEALNNARRNASGAANRATGSSQTPPANASGRLRGNVGTGGNTGASGNAAASGNASANGNAGGGKAEGKD